MKIGKVEITHPEKELFPNIQKKEFINYYSKISFKMLRFLRNRPLVMERFPRGVFKDKDRQKGFFQKEYPDYFPSYIDSVEVKQKKGGKKRYAVVNNKDSLIYIANQDCIEFHTWLSKINNLNKPDKLVFDLDPSKNFEEVYGAAFALKEFLDKNNLKSYLMSTGSKGLHVVVPIKKEFGFDEVKDIADKIAEKVSSKNKNFTTEMRKEKRKGRLLIDVARNSYAQTSVCPFSVRAKKEASVAIPLRWKDLNKRFDLSKYRIGNFGEIKSLSFGAWRGYERTKNSLKVVKQV